MNDPGDAHETINLKVVGKLRALSHGGKDTFAELVALFLSDLPRSLGALTAAAERGDRPTLARFAHALRGASSNLGASELAGVCERLERRALGDDAFDLEHEVARVLDCVKVLEARLKDLIGSVQ